MQILYIGHNRNGAEFSPVQINVNCCIYSECLTVAGDLCFGVPQTSCVNTVLGGFGPFI